MNELNDNVMDAQAVTELSPKSPSVCGRCAHYSPGRAGTPVCTRTGREVGYLWKKECFAEASTSTDTIDNDIQQIQGENIMNESKENTAHLRHCRRCGRDLPLAMYGKRAGTVDGYSYICKDCKSEVARTNSAKSAKMALREPLTSCKQPEERPVPAKPEREPAVPSALPEAPAPRPLAGYEDDELVAELHRRGFVGSISKNFTI